MKFCSQARPKDWVSYVLGQRNDDPLHPDYVPSIFPCTKSPDKRRLENKLRRFETARHIKQKKFNKLGADVQGAKNVQSTIAEPLADRFSSMDQEALLEYTRKSEEEKQRLESENTVLRQQISALHADNLSLRSETLALKDSLSAVSLSQASFENDDKKVAFLTGLPSYQVMVKVLGLVEQFITDHHNRKLSNFQEFLLVLMRLRLNLCEQYLAYRFQVNQSTVCRIFYKCILVLSKRLSALIFWPDRAVLRKTMPTAFREHFAKCAVIIDCFEVFTERPQDLLARAQTWSQYKHHNTAKFLVGISPQGTIIFISKAYGGRSSDVYITEDCGVLSNLLPGDVVLADRGFTVEDSVNYYMAELKVPAFTKGKPQLSQKEVDWSRELAHVRIHVERVIGLLRNKFTIFQSTIPIKLLMSKSGVDENVIDDMIVVCAALCNLCESVVPLD